MTIMLSKSFSGAEVAFANPPSMTDMGAMGSWAEIMAEEQVDSAMPGEKQNENQKREEDVRDLEDGIQKPPKQQSFAVQVANLPVCSDEELFYYFGGDNVVRDVAILPDRPYAARIDLFTLEGLKRAKELDGKKFRDRILKVYEIREDRIRERPPPHESHSRQYSNEPTIYNRENSRYNSQSSIHSSDARNFERNSRPYNSSNDYRNSSQNRYPPTGGTFSRGRYYNSYDDYNNGRYSSGGHSCRGNGAYYVSALSCFSFDLFSFCAGEDFLCAAIVSFGI
uniref:RRM domain-containing protein n=1 Tax=Angiostrongylus cantonensis TaxID=6313 RepID=A0A0K0DNK9_ANGCA